LIFVPSDIYVTTSNLGFPLSYIVFLVDILLVLL
ncbi:uncharacterized protein METZ01_LOCUS308400, partial [marine metagenome]